MNTSSATPLARAKAGNADAIAQVINQSLLVKQIIARVTLKGGLLRILLSSAQPLNQQEMLYVLRKGITALKPAHVNEVEIISQRSDKEKVDLAIWE